MHFCRKSPSSKLFLRDNFCCQFVTFSYNVLVDCKVILVSLAVANTVFSPDRTWFTMLLFNVTNVLIFFGIGFTDNVFFIIHCKIYRCSEAHIQLLRFTINRNSITINEYLLRLKVSSHSHLFYFTVCNSTVF